MRERHEFRYWYDVKVLKVVDGDTVDVLIDLGLDTSMKMRCRLYGINTPETRGPTRQAGLEAKQFLKELLDLSKDSNGNVLARTHKDRRDKYGRYLIEFFQFDGCCINNIMVARGHAVSYMID